MNAFTSLLFIGEVVITTVAGKCAGCGRAAMIWLSVGGRTCCVSCAPVKR